MDVLLMLLGALLGMAANYATSQTDHVPWPLRLLREWSVPLVAVVLLLLVAGQVWLHFLERPVAIARTWNSSQPPYPGLEAFTEDDGGVFFGRDREIRDLVGRLNPSAPARAHRFVAVIGPSGSGKSSLVRAGLLPTLRRRRGRWVITPAFAPGADPLVSFASSVAAVLPDMTVEQVQTELAQGSAGMQRCLDRLRTARGGRAAPVLLVVDQLEELLTLTGAQDRLAFFSLIDESLAADPHLWVVATLRSDFLTDFLGTGYAALIHQPTLVGALGRTELFEVIEKPAEQAALSFAPGVVARMVDDTEGGDALPLLAYTLQELFLRVSSGGTVTEDDYRRLGGVAGALSEHADRITADLRAADADTPVLSTLLKFVTLEHGEPTRRRVHRDDLTPEERTVTDAFVTGRLLTSDNAVLDVAHEALFRQWAPLRQAVAASTDKLRRRTELERWAQDWERSSRQDAYLLSGERLAVAREWAGEASEALAGVPLVTAFLERSTRQDRASMERVADAVAHRALESAERDPELAILAALAAIDECAPTSAAQQALHTALGASRRRAVFRGHEQDVNAVTWSPDGSRLATASDDGTVRIWDAREAGNPVVLTRRHGDGVYAVAWSPDGKRLAGGSRNRSVTIWDAETWAEMGVLIGHDDSVGALAWSPDGDRLATASSDRTVRIWDAETHAELTVLTGHEQPVWDLAWSPGRGQLASASDDGTVRVWSLTPGGPTTELTGHQASVSAVAWSPDGCCLASVSEDRTALVWNIAVAEEEGREPQARKLTSLTPLNCVTWSPDGRHIAVGDDDCTVRVWDTDTSEESQLIGHTDSVHDIAWHGHRIATVSRDRTVAIWDAPRRGSRTGTLLGHDDSVQNVSWSPDGTRLATASQDGTAVIWDVAQNSAVATLRHEGAVFDLAWSPDGERLVTASRGAAARIWDVRGRTQLAVLRGHGDELTTVSWSPDGTRIATSSRDSTTRIWNASDGTELTVLRGAKYWIGGAAWSPDSRHLATSSTDRTLCVWDILRGTAVTTLHGHTDYAWRVAWSPDGRRLASGSRDRTVRLWDPFSGAELVTMTGHQERVQGVAWSPDGRHLATVSWDRTVRLWNPDDGRELTVIGVHDDQVNGLAWHPDGSYLATVSRDRSVRIWEPTTDMDRLLRLARSRVFRRLTDDERRSFLLPTTRARV
ncbi:NACHT and WD repeat domain-containing protein [[Kitasatospora] papulosa]|uniref:NACHT and WD repeat domain-containing protein n=1 Tax=[Kitasatospora] papulosa TaxID=1464011 RepID=UPI0037F8847F